MAAAVVTAAAAAPSRAADPPPPVVTVTAPAATTTVPELDLAHWVDAARASEGASSLPEREAQRAALQLLVSLAWIGGEAGEQGIVVTDAQVQKSFDEQRRQSFPKDADFQRFLRQTHQTVADIQLRVRSDLLSDRIRDKVTAPAAAAVTGAQVEAAVRKAGPEVMRAEVRAHLVSDAEQTALDAFVTAFTAKWKARTTCAPAYVWDSDCANWDGTPSG